MRFLIKLKFDANDLANKINKMIPDIAETLAESIKESVVYKSQGLIDPKVIVKDNKITVVSYKPGDADIEKRLHPFEYTINDLGNIIKKLGW